MTGPKRVTEKQLAANRANALRSTGPQTAQGRAAVRYNALTHGVLAQAVIPEALEPYESRAAFEALLATLREEFAPGNSIEELLVEQIAAAYWRLSRLYRAEAGAIAQAHDDAETSRQRGDDILKVLALSPVTALDPLTARRREIENRLNNKRQLRSAMVSADPSLADLSDDEIRQAAERELDALTQQIEQRDRQQEQHCRAVESAINSLPPIDDAIKFARYETALQNQLDRALSRLERLQRLRGGEAVAPPVQVEVSVNETPDAL